MSESLDLSIKETAIGIHECFINFIDAGFTREEALELVKAMIRGQK